MGKIIFWIVVVFAVLFALRMWNAAKADAAARREPPARRADRRPMVRCVRMRRVPAQGRRAVDAPTAARLRLRGAPQARRAAAAAR